MDAWLTCRLSDWLAARLPADLTHVSSGHYCEHHSSTSVYFLKRVCTKTKKTSCRPISTSVPLTSSRAKIQRKSACFHQNYMSQKHPGNRKSTQVQEVYLWPDFKTKTMFWTHKIAACPFNIELLTDRVSGWLTSGYTGRKVYGGIQRGEDWLIGCMLTVGWTSDSLVGWMLASQMTDWLTEWWINTRRLRQTLYEQNICLF